MYRVVVGVGNVEMTPQEVAQWEAEQAANQPKPMDPLTQPLSKRQINAALILGAGILSPDDFIRSILEAIVDPTARSLALNDWETAPYYMRDHPLFTDTAVLAAAEMTTQQVDALWALGYQQPK